MLPNANDEATPGEAGQATAQAPAAAGRRDDHAAEIGALPATSGAASASAPTATLASAPVSDEAGVEMRVSQAPGLTVPSAGTYFGEHSKTALAAQAVLLKKMEAPAAEDASQLQLIDAPTDAIVAVATAAPGPAAEQSGNTNDAPDHSDAR
ncbi:hypothetical protein [Xanthomonas sp. 3307]|uniref:hypothetical protein n=1 Tax=Xanthomonas sp. 3307 TaxID=3035316 RepID=UPI00160FFE9B|nr:hypothetical protein [Xanthomonas sp. 3307]MBB5942484.1 hypothetical protein [Xanthomonas sp. 3307]